MKIFVTGITSFLGKSFLPKLINKLNDNDVLYLLVRKKIPINDNRIIQLIGSLEKIEDFKRQLLECDYIFHLAANAVFQSGADYFGVNFIPTKKIVDIARESSILKNFIFISTVGAFDRHKNDNCIDPININSIPNPRSEYGRSKLEAEKYIIANKIPYTIIRPTWIYGKDMRANSHINQFVNMVISKSPIIKFNLRGKVSVVYVEDLAKALVNAIENKDIVGKSYFCSSEHISIGEIFRLIYKKIYGTDIKQIELPNLEFLFRRTHHIFPVSLNNLFLDYLCADSGEFWKDFRIEKRVKIEEGIDDVINSNPKLSGYYVITGANSGIGFSLANQLNLMGKKLILIDKDTDNLSKFEKHKVIKCDLTDFVNDTSLLDEIQEEKIYCLINNAGIGLKGSFDDLEEERIKRIVFVNALAPVLLTKKFMNNLIKNNGIIVNIISNIAFNPLPGMSLYSATKAFLCNWSESITYELRKTNLVITFAPSGTYTNFQRNSGVKVLNEGKGLLSPDYVAQKIIEAIEKKKSYVILGFSSKILLLFSKFLPKKLNIMLWGKLLEKFR